MYKVAEIFVSINGEGTRAGQLAVFVRFHGCNLCCSYCDTQWANHSDTHCRIMTATKIMEEIHKTGVNNVTLTGGEPLKQEHILELLKLLAQDKQLHVEIETNGSVPLTPFIKIENRPDITMDYKLPSSGMETSMCLDNLELLQKQDTIKFVSGNMTDLNRARAVIDEYDLTQRCAVYFSPVFGQLEPDTIVEYLKQNRMNGVTLQLQLHKIIWDPNARGV